MVMCESMSCKDHHVDHEWTSDCVGFMFNEAIPEPAPKTRPGWDDYFLGIAKAVSERGDCTRSKVGAVLVDKKRIVVATGYNGQLPNEPGCLTGACPRGRHGYDSVPANTPYDDPVKGCTGIHGEDNVLRFARIAGQTQRMVGAVIYVTREPCEGCHKLILEAGVGKSVWPGGSYDYR